MIDVIFLHVLKCLPIWSPDPTGLCDVDFRNVGGEGKCVAKEDFHRGREGKRIYEGKQQTRYLFLCAWNLSMEAWTLARVICVSLIYS